MPLVGDRMPSLDLRATGDPTLVLGRVWSAVTASPAILTTAVALAIVAGLLPYARSRGRGAIALLCVGEVALILGSAPSLPPTSIVLGAWALCGVLMLGRAR
jgi:hypothetical protein